MTTDNPNDLPPDDSTEFDPDTHALLDSLDDEINPDEIAEGYRYRIIALLPEGLKTLIREAGEAVDLTIEPAFIWQADFTTENQHAIAAVLDEWVQTFFPIQTKFERVFSDVIGEQTYIAGWQLTNADLMVEAQNDLTTKLAPMIVPNTDTSATFRPVLPVMMGVPAEAFPQLVAHLHQNFEAIELSIGAVELQRLPLEPETDAEWESMGNFHPST